MNHSKHKEKIYEIIYSNPLHLTADDIYYKLREVDSSVGIATVYRNIAKLVEEGKVLKLCSAGDKDRFDANTNAHYHFYCVRCGYIEDVDYIDDIHIDEQIFAHSGHKVCCHELVIRGICKKCLEGEVKND